MKKLITSLLAVAGLALSAHAAHFGASAGYLADSEEAYFTVRGGLTLKDTATVLHLAELELGYTEESEPNLKGDIIPLMVNYRAEFVSTGKLSPFVGVGAGAAFVKLKAFWLNDEDITFGAQAFAGFSYKASDRVALSLAARYIWLNDADLFGIDVDMGDDVAIEAGISFKF